MFGVVLALCVASAVASAAPDYGALKHQAVIGPAIKVGSTQKITPLASALTAGLSQSRHHPVAILFPSRCMPALCNSH